MDQFAPDDSEPHSEIARLEQLIEELTLKLETCRKYSGAALAAMGLGAVLLAAGIFGVIALDPVTLLAAAAALMGGIVLAGSNRSTAREIQAQLAEAEEERRGLIGRIQLRVVTERPVLH
ncbi:hypothetical protein [Rhodoplanes sp. Z2-YC6860]|uniref:hypothetical protein n=1 Tax=Rhodoplanes sp. Z2-YC6860 TaxID=674703 RepID=UPI00078BDB68|nr:hypothetical protein [Rhodoplanes sp. Z2-YC6860]AMN39789.1 hypothetical protein RHPLAN_13340 [Rhodoplanes sp. Z2-YC6860]